MKNFTTALLALIISTGAMAQSAAIKDQLTHYQYGSQNRLVLAKPASSVRISEAQAPAFVAAILNNRFSALEAARERDDNGTVHIRYNIYKNGIRLFGKQVVAHFSDGMLEVINGDLEINSGSESFNFNLDEGQALVHALNKVGASEYMWQNEQEAQHMRQVLNDPSFTYYPHGEKVLFEKEGNLLSAWKFNIYAKQPLYRANVFVDAVSGKILDEQNLLCNADVAGSAVTKYSGTQTVTVDQNGSTFRLRQSQRGQGIETYNLNNGTSYFGATDFTSTSSSYTSTGFDQGATDGHWGAEKTYDYFFLQHQRNSINNAGHKLLSYVHYGNNYANAFWDGQRMTYGDGNGSSWRIFTALDVCGHEITHGLTDFTSNLIYSYESGALNESFSDIFGVAIENFARPSNWNWKIGEDITSSNAGLRNMSSPNNYGDPDTYKGNYWYGGTADNGGVHTNSGVPNYWFYLLVTGGSGTNDLSQSYSIQGIGMTAAARIAFRALTVYFTPTTDFVSARIGCIQAAKDLFGDCSNEMIQTANAWYAVGVGQQVSANAVNPDFVAEVAEFCSLPATVSFSNATPYAQNYTWYFGDGAVSSALNPVHTYTAAGNYSVKLKASGCTQSDSVQKQAFVVVELPAKPAVSTSSVCYGSPVTLSSGVNKGFVQWFQSPTLANSVNSGNSLAIASVTGNATYYVNNTYTTAPLFGGISLATGGGYLNNSSHYLIFDVLQNSTLNTVVVYAQTTGLCTIELRNSSKFVLDSKMASLIAGANTLTLDFALTPGTDYELGLASNNNSSLHRSNSNVSYPYNVGNCAKITGSSAGAGFYYWYYNWKITRASCVSDAAPVSVEVMALPQVFLSAASETLCVEDEVALTGMPSGGTLTGAGVVGTSFYPGATGMYTVSYTFTDANGCSGSDEVLLIASECLGLGENGTNSIKMFPNPAAEILFVDGLSSGMQVLIFDGSGRLIRSVEAEQSMQVIDLKNYAAGLYMIRVNAKDGGTVMQEKLIRQ